MDKLDELHEFWKQERPEGNFFRAVPPNSRSGTIATALLGHLTPETSLLEVGCNVGRNLNHLFTMGQEHLGGIEINPHAVERLRTEYPKLANVPIYTGTAEDVLPTLPENGYDIVFTMAVLEHIHPDSPRVYADIARVREEVRALNESRGSRLATSHIVNTRGTCQASTPSTG